MDKRKNVEEKRGLRKTQDPMATALDLRHIVSQPLAFRDSEWENAFFTALTTGTVRVESPTAQAFSDGWPYLYVRTEAGAGEPVRRIIDWLTERGVGLLVNGHKDAPDYVFTYGMLWNYRETGKFVTPTKHVPTGTFELRPGQKVWTLQPQDKTLPMYVRKILLQFFEDQDILEPRINMVSVDQQHYDFCISLESLSDPPPQEHAGIAEALAWFFPAHYSIALVSEKRVPNFQRL